MGFNDTGSGTGTGFQLFTQVNNDPGIYADAAARDVYFGANPTELARLDANSFLIIKLLDDGSGEIAYQQRASSAWVDVTSIVQGDTGPAGATGNSYFFASIADRDTFFGTSPNEGLLETDLPITVNVGNDTTTTLVWTGTTAPASYDSTLWRTAALEVSSGTLFLGESGSSISSGNEVLNFITAGGVDHYMHGIQYSDAGSIGPEYWEMSALVNFVLADVFSDDLPDPQNSMLTNSFNTYIKQYALIPATSGELRVQTWLGVDNTGPVLLDVTVTVLPGDVGNETIFNLPNNMLVLIGESTFTTFSGIQLKGGVQTTGSYIGNITGVSDSGGVARFATDAYNYAVGQSVTLAGLSNYANGLYQITASGGLYFEISSIAYSADDTGTYGLTQPYTELDLWPATNAQYVTSLDLVSVNGAVPFFSSTGSELSSDANFLYDSTLKTLSIKSPSGTGNATIDLVNSAGTPKGSLIYDETNGELAVRATGTTSEVHLNGVSYVYRGVNDGRIDVHTVSGSGSALLTLSNVGGGTGLSLEHDDSTDDSIIDSEIGNLTIRTSSGTEDIIISATGNVGVGTTTPASTMHVYEDNSNTDATAGLTIEQDGLGDALVQFLLTGGQRWVTGIDNSSSGNDFSISGRGALGGSTSNLTLDNTQGLILKNDSSATGVFDTISGIRLDNVDGTDGTFTTVASYGTANIAAGIAFVNDDYSANTGHIELGIRGAGGFTHALTLQEGNYGNVNSTNLIFNIGDEGTNQSEFVMFNDSHATEIIRYFRMSYADEIATQGGINISDANNYVSIGTRTDPDSPLHIYQNDTETGDQAGLTIEQDGTGDAITQYLLSGGQRWVTGIDNSGSDAFKIASSINLGSNDQLVLETDGRSEFLGKLGVNILPASTFHVYEDTAEVGAAAGLTIEQDGVGDAIAQFLVTGGQRWVMGIDNSQDDEFCISSTLDLNSNKRLVLQTDGKNYFNGTLGVGKIPDDNYRLDVLTAISTVVGLSSFKAVTIEAGNNGSGNSTDLFFNRGNVGFNQSEFTMFNDNNASGPARMFRMGYSDDIDTSGGLTVWKTRNNVAVGTYTQPDSVLTVSEDTTETGDQAGLTIIQEGTGDAVAQFLLDGGQRWVMGIDNSGNDAFKIASSINLGSDDMFVLEPDAGAFIYSHTDDVLTLGNSTGETSKISVDNAGDPEGVVTGTGGDLHINSNGVSSRMALKKSSGSSTADWYDVALVPPVEKVIYNTTELEAMATAGVITVSSSTTWKIKGHLDSDTRIVLANRAQLHIVTDNSNQSSWTYSGTGTFLSGTGGFRSLEFFDILSSSTGTFTSLDLDGRSMNLTLCGLFLWDDLGSLSNGTFILDVSDIFENDLGFDFTNMKITITQSNISDNEIGSTPMFDVDNSFVGAKSISVNQLSGSFNAGSSLFRIGPALDSTGKADISGCIFTGGQLFDTSGATGEFSAVADASVPTETITSVTDSSGVARFNFSAPPTLFEDQEVVISGYGTRTNFNGPHIVTATGAGYFEVAGIDYEAGVDSGSFISNSVTMTDTGTTLSDGDQIVINTLNSTDYDNGAVVYNQLTNTFQVNRTWVATETGTWSQAGLNQSDPRVIAHDNPDYADSKYLAFGHIEENPIANTTVIASADTYQAANLTGTTGFLTVFATNGAGGTTCTSATHGLVENQNVVLTGGDEYYRGTYTVFNVLTNTFDIAITYQSTVLTSPWTSGVISDSERFKVIDPTVCKFEYIGNEPFEGSIKTTWSVNKTATSEDYIFSSGKNGVSPEQGAPFQKRTVTTSTSVHPVTIPVNLIAGDTIQPILAGVGTTNSITVENLQMEVS